MNSIGVNSFDICYKITNFSNKNFDNLKFYVYLYQIYEDNIIFNSMLSDEILYEGSLYYEIDKLLPESCLSFKLNLYAPCLEDIFSTCLLVDIDNKTIYLSPVTICCYMED